ncbi:MAG: hypothetical protein KC496_09950 [Anaerolineae bacterium]|nr:hypothetical protein [Anaerolineae bacterium]
MRVTDLLARAKDFHGQSVQLEGRMIVVFERGSYLPFFCASTRLRRTNHVRIQQPFPELRRIIQPMSLHLLRLERGYMVEKPYLYNFPAKITATCYYGRGDEIPRVRDIREVQLHIPYPPRLRPLVDAPEWEYHAQVEYASLNNLETMPEHRAQIQHRRILHFAPNRPDIVQLAEGESRYARQFLNKTLQIPGKFSFDNGQSILETDAIRVRMLSRTAHPATIWMPESAQDRVIKICGGLNPLLYDGAIQSSIIGKIRYLRSGETIPPEIQTTKLVFSRVYAIELYGQSSLRHRHPQPQLL